MQRASRAAIALLASTALGACGAGEGGRSETLQATVDSVGGVERILYPGHGGAALRWKADTVAVIGGALVEEDAYHFDRVVTDGLASDGAGRLYVLDAAGRRVLVYDAEGRHVATHGRPGGGPGELAAPSALAIGPGDSIWVADVGNRRYNIFPPTGGDAHSIPYPDAAGVRSAPRGRRRRSDQAFRPFLAVGATGQCPSRPHHPAPRDNGSVRTIWTTPPPRMDEVRPATAAGAGDRDSHVRAFGMPQLWRRFTDGRFVVADTASTCCVSSTRTGRKCDASPGTRHGRPPTPTRSWPGRDCAIRSGAAAASASLQRRRRRRPRSAGAPARAAPQAQLDTMTFAPVIPRITGLPRRHAGPHLGRRLPR